MTENAPGDDEGGESSCYAHLICPECGIVLDGSAHSKGCTWEKSAPDCLEKNSSAPDSND
jgi:hypothetical protein